MKKIFARTMVWLMAMSLLLAGLTACGGEKVPEQDEIFSKTIHDFEGFHVVQLGEEEDQNFLVYAQDTQQIQVSQENNRVIAVDQEAMIYTFADPDEQLLSMEPGTVFFAEASPQNPSGIAVKVKEIQVSGNTATVYSDPVGMEDLFEHVNIDKDMSLTDVYYDESQLEEGMEIQVLSREEAVAAGVVSTESAVEGNTASMGSGAEIGETSTGAAADTGSTSTESVAGESLGGSAGFQWEGGDNKSRILLSTGHSVDLGIASSGNLQGKMHYQYKNQVLMRSIHVQFRYDKATNYFHTNVGYFVDTLWEASLAFEGTWSNGRGGMGHTWPKISFFIPNTPIQVGVETFLLTELNGSMKGSLSQTESFRVSSSSTYYQLVKVAEDNVCEPTGKTSDAKLELEGSVEASYGVRADIGIPFVVDVFAEGSLGARAKGTLAMLGETEDEDSIHDCEHCLDGDIEVFAKVNVGVDARIVTTITGKDLVYRWEIAELAIKVGDFYASYREGADGGVECGFGPCPHLRWKVKVTVMTEEDGPAQYAYVNAKYPDGRTDRKMTDEQGVAVFYLPNGDNTLNCAHQGEKGSGHAFVEDGPTTAKLDLEDKRQLFVCYRFWADHVNTYPHFDFTEVQNILQMNYPDAVYIHIDEWQGHIQNSLHPTWVLGNHTSAGLDEAYGIAEGDVILFVQAHTGKYGVRGYYNFSAWVSVFLLPDMEEEEETTEAVYESQFGVEGDIVAEDVPYMISVYQGDFWTGYNTNYDRNSRETYVTEVFYDNSEKIWQGLRIDKNYRIQEVGTEWVTTEWKDPAPGAGMSEVAFQDGYIMHHDNLANYVFRAFPYIDRLMSGEWNQAEEVQP